MKKEYGLEYKVSYMLGNMYHTYLIIAQNEKEAKQKALNTIPETSKPILHDFKVERYYRTWNWSNETIISNRFKRFLVRLEKFQDFAYNIDINEKGR